MEQTPATDDATIEPQPTVLDVHADREAAIEAAAAAIEAGKLIVIPTDTVYGIAADAMNAGAVQALLDAKVRGRDMPPPVLIADAFMLGSLVDEVPESAGAMTRAFWPGALTVILTSQGSLGMDLGETRGTIAVRVPDHDVTRDLLRRTGPLAVSSANISGLPAANTAAQAVEMLGGSVAVYLDAGHATDEPLPSSIVDFSSSSEGRLVRLGALSLDALRQASPLLDAGEFAPAPEGGPLAEDFAADEPVVDDPAPGTPASESHDH